MIRRISRLKSSPRDGSAPQYTLRKCGVVPREDRVRLRVAASDDGRSIGYAEGVVHCGSISGCPVCGAKIRTRRAAIYSESAARWLEAGNTLLMVTLTFPHDMGMPLAPLWDLVSKGVSRLTSSHRWRELRDELGGMWYRRALEQTWGCNGWHPHCHMAVYIRGDVGARGLVDLSLYFRDAWAKWITSQGYRLPSGQHGVKVDVCTRGADTGEYLVKTQDGRSAGNELARADLKTGRKGGWTPFEIVREFAATGDADLRALWREFEAASKGRRIITESRGLAGVLGENEVTDQELADEEAGGEDVAELGGRTWAQVCDAELEAPVLEAVVSGGLAGVNQVLGAAGLALAYPPPRPRERGS